MMPMTSYMGPTPMGPSPVSNGAFLDDISRQISMSQQSRRYSRGSNAQSAHSHSHSHSQHSGNAMRVVKTTSANNSPRSALIQARRRTMANDGLMARRNQQFLEQALIPSPSVESSYVDPTKRTARPVSWHPSTQMAQLPQQQQCYAYQQPQQASPLTQYPFPSYSEVDIYTQYQQQFPPTPAAFSGCSSPTAFSPLSLPYSSFEAPQYTARDGWATAPAQPSKAAVSPTSDCPELDDQPARPSALSEAAAHWAAFTQGGFEKDAASPPTPATYPVALASEPVISSDDNQNEDEDDEGEVLIGMGLYDPPEKPLNDSTLDGYHASVSQLLGSSYNYPEPTGKGLKLEDAWEPPVKDDDEEEEEDGDEDAEGEDSE